MNFERVRVDVANIHGLEEKPHYFEHHDYYAWKIYFSQSSTQAFHNLSCIRLGNEEKESEELCENFKENFKRAGIVDGARVAVLFGTDREIIAIGALGKDYWIDVNDMFTPKIFSDFNIVISSLKIC